MEPEKNTKPDEENRPPEDEQNVEQEAPADALSRTPDDLEQEAAEKEAANPKSGLTDEELAEKKISPIRRFFRKVNVYFLVFVLLIIVAGAITVVNYLNSAKDPVEPNVATQELTEEALKDLANTDASVGNTSQTLTIQGNAIISGQTLLRGNLNVAGNLQTGGEIRGPTITVSGASNFGDTQINTLQVASNTAVQGTTTLRDLNVSGTTSFSGPVTASQLTVSRLILSGNAVLQVPNHVSFTGPTPSHSNNAPSLGSGGSISISGSDTAGTIQLRTGNGTTSGCWTRITFQQAFPSQPRVVVSPVDAAAGQTQYYVERNNVGFSLCTNNAAPTNQSFSFDYFVTF